MLSAHTLLTNSSKSFSTGRRAPPVPAVVVMAPAPLVCNSWADGIEQTDRREALLGRVRQMREQRARKTLLADDRHRALIEAARAHRPQADIDDRLGRHDQRAGYQRRVAEPQARHRIHAMQRIGEQKRRRDHRDPCER